MQFINDEKDGIQWYNRGCRLEFGENKGSLISIKLDSKLWNKLNEKCDNL